MTPRVSSIAPDVVVRWVGDGSVTVDGTVRSFADHVAALRAAWGLPGVRCVHDGLAIQLVPSLRKDR
jgi:osmotically-inducible protein OsmY